MRLPRDISGEQLARALKSFGYNVTRQTGSHLRLTTIVGGEHHVTVPHHSSLRVGTLAAILDEVVAHVGTSREELLQKIRS